MYRILTNYVQRGLQTPFSQVACGIIHKFFTHGLGVDFSPDIINATVEEIDPSGAGWRDILRLSTLMLPKPVLRWR
jgi:hypothetical protein